MEIRPAASPKDVKNYTTARLREEFLIQNLFVNGALKLVYSQVDRMVIGGVCPVRPIALEAAKELGAAYFLERRELGIINIGPPGTITAAGQTYQLNTRDGLYIGTGVREINFASSNASNPARFYFNSAPAHQSYPIQKIEIAAAESSHLGSMAESNERTIYKYIHPQGVKSCQLVMGLTVLEPNCVWNTMPCHTHDRRMEVYLYLQIPDNAAVFHLMGEPDETRHLVIRDQEAVIAPSWSIHSGVGTTNYAFIWGMAGENQTFSDMDAVSMADLK